MEAQGDFGLTRLEHLERRVQALEDAEAIRNLKSAARPCAMTTMMRMGSPRSSLRMRPGTARAWVGSRAGTQSEISSKVRQGFSLSLQPERPNIRGWRYRAGAVVPVYAMHGGGRKSRHVARQHRP
jgi:hypothetical protein